MEASSNATGSFGAGTMHQAAEWLRLAATPAFATMALLTGITEAGGVEMLCAGGPRSWVGGMMPMYLLMAALHSSPWLALISSRRRQVARQGTLEAAAAEPARQEIFARGTVAPCRHTCNLPSERMTKR